MELNLDREIKYTFVKIWARINPITIKRSFYIIYKTLFISLLAANKVEKRLLRPISNYFVIIEINWHRILHLYCYVWLKNPS